MAEEARRIEIDEAIRAGERALKSLKGAEKELSGAKNWGIVDLLGGGLFTNMMKHSRINDASSCLERAKADLRVFKRELKDIPNYEDLGIDIGNFLAFSDFFFDGLIVDFMVQSKINDARSKVQNAIRKVERLLLELKAQR